MNDRPSVGALAYSVHGKNQRRSWLLFNFSGIFGKI